VEYEVLCQRQLALFLREKKKKDSERDREERSYQKKEKRRTIGSIHEMEISSNFDVEQSAGHVVDHQVHFEQIIYT